MKYEAYIDGIGKIGEYETEDDAIDAIQEAIRKDLGSHGFVLYDGELVYGE